MTPNWTLLTRSLRNKVGGNLFPFLNRYLVEAGIEDPDDDDDMLAALDAELGGIGLTNKGGGGDESSSEPDEPDPAIH